MQGSDHVRRYGQPVLTRQKVIEQLGAVCTQVSPTEYLDAMRALVQAALERAGCGEAGRAVLRHAVAGAGAEQRTAGSIEVDKNGRLGLSGPIRGLQCPAGSAGGSERLEIKLGNTVLQTITAAPYLDNTLTIDIAQALQAAGINASSFASGTGTVTRTGSPRGGFWGSSPAPLLSLQISSGLCLPPAGTQFCITPILRSDGSRVGSGYSEAAINDRGEVLFTASAPMPGAVASRLWLKGQVTDLPAGLRNAAHLNNQGTVVGHFDANPPPQDGTDVAVVTAGGSPVILPVPAAPAGLNAIGRQIPLGPGYLALGDDGTIVGSALVAGIPDPQNPPAGCRVAEWCCFNHVLKWSPPYSSYTVLDGPHAVGGAQTTGGFVQLCGPQTGNQFRTLNLYDGRAWPMTASTLVDAALGWDFMPIVSQCYAWGINPQSMNRNGNWIGQPLP